MSDRTRSRINAAFDDELSTAPAPAGLRALAIRDAVTAAPRRSVQPQLLVVIATIVVVALVATFVIGSHVLRSTSPVPAKPSGSIVPPAPRSEAAFTYDGAHRELVLFGGSPIQGDVGNEMWTWDGEFWAMHHVTPAPSPRRGAAMAYDFAHHEVVLYGGTTGAGVSLTDTWTWNGSVWVRQHPKADPELDFSWPVSMGFDPASKSLILYGFFKVLAGNQSTMEPQTWSWNGSDWVLAVGSSGPSSIGKLVATDSHLYLLAQSNGRVAGQFVTQMWRWDGSTWTLVPSSNTPIAFLNSAAYDPLTARVVAFDGDTWTWDGSRWTREHTTAQPRAVGYMAYFPPRRQLLSFGSLYGDTNNDLWAWNGTTWVQVAAGTIVPPTPSGQLGPTTPAAAEAFIRQTTTATKPALFPQWLPSGMEATVTATADGFNLDLYSDQRDKHVFLGTVVANPPPGGPNSSDTHVRFRNAIGMKYQSAGTAEYFVYDPTAGTSDRWLMWIEPGTTSIQGSTSPGVWYYLFASGLTDQEFWQVANSLQ